MKRAKKGFIHTLEAVLATFFFFGFLILILPALREPAGSGQIESLRISERLSTLDASGDLANYVSKNNTNLSGLKDKLSNESSPSYQYTLGSVSYAAETVVGNRQVDFTQGENIITEMVFSAWRGTSADIQETIIWGSEGPKNGFVAGATINLTTIRLSPTSIRLNLVSSAERGQYRYRIKRTEVYGAIPQNTTVWTSSYMPSEGNLQVFANST